MADSSDRFYDYRLSWLAFNERVLQEAADSDNPIVERMRFLGIFSNNQDEFFRVRFAQIQRELELNHNPKEQTALIKLLRAIQRKTTQLSEQFDAIYNDLLAELAKRNIYCLNENNLTAKQGRWLHRHFTTEILPHIVPLWVDRGTDLQRVVNDGESYLMVELRQNHDARFALIAIPTAVSRFIPLQSEDGRAKKYFMLIDDAIRYCMNDIFGGLYQTETARCWSMKITRDAEYSLDSDLDTSLVEKMSDGVKQRLTSEPVRLSFDKSMPKGIREILADGLGFDEYDTYLSAGRYRNFRDFIGFPNMGPRYLEEKPLEPLLSAAISQSKNLFEAIDSEDLLVYYPYHQFNHFTEFVRQAAFDPSVSEIRINIYRVANRSLVVDSLIDAARNGKKVVVNVELTARFDEQRNIELSERLQAAGIKVTLGIPTLKIHSKLCLIIRNVEGQERLYAHIGTGNFNENTARIYTDFSLFTSHAEIAAEVRNVFTYIEYSYRHFDFDHLIVSPVNSRTRLVQLITAERRLAEANQPARIDLKLNNLVDRELISQLYQASRVGVKIRLIVRGMCALIPGVKGMSENISVISIVDRFLEHPRVMIFHNGGQPKVFISSADWMTRNIDRRVEVATPIYSEPLQKRIMDIFDLQFSDRVKARVIDEEQKNLYVKRGNKRKIRSQIEIYNYLKASEKSALRR
ncbi:polyphosphate kinase 1 [Gammaproteobacteria bacterium LSUCC0057]|uniref:Polyphosphate kinase n=1 Tax=Gammaproteobacteria bacterium LSUCC0057 TaxID=2559237 RepID=A0A4Y8UED2_9GAMM|nr:polyphosphate kinase 1 [Gammaproteobacteria bacterium LSUCC0057]